MPMTPKQMIKLLESNGFRQTHSNGSHFFFRNDETHRTTTVPVHAKTQGLNKSCKGGFYE